MTQVKDDTLPEIEIELEEVEPLNNMESIEEQPEPQIEEEEEEPQPNKMSRNMVIFDY
eukprot:00538.XXX_1870_1637_1 [CDS] Oithona nana genome sequencing.